MRQNTKAEAAVRSHPLVEEISDERRSGDGIWAYMRPGWIREKHDAVHCVHEDTWTAVLRGLRDAHPCACDECKAEAL